MTATTDSYGMNADRLDAGHTPWRAVVASIAIGLVLGGLLGALFGATRPGRYEATSALSVLPDSVVNSQQDQNSPTVDSTAFIQSQLVVLNGSQLADQIKRQLSLRDRPIVSATQVGQSYVVQIRATAANRQRAMAVATAAGSVYAKQRSQALTSDINASLTSVKQQLSNVKKNLEIAQNSTPITDGLTPSETALQTEYERLLTVQSTLNLALPQVDRVVSVLSPASGSPDAISSTLKYLVAGALLGAIAGLAVLLLLRRSVSRVRSVADLAALGVPVLLPVLPRLGNRDTQAGLKSAPARLLAARLAGPDRQPIVLTATNRSVGASFVAAAIAANLTGRGPVLLVRTGAASGLPAAPAGYRPSALPAGVRSVPDAVASGVDGLWLLDWHAPGTRVAGSGELNRLLTHAADAGWQVVLDAPALPESGLALDCLAAAGAATLVVGRGTSSPSDVLSAVELIQAHGGRLAGLILNDAPTGRFGRRRPSGSGQEAAESAATDTAEPVREADSGLDQPTGRRAAARSRGASRRRDRQDERESDQDVRYEDDNYEQDSDIVPYPADQGR